jgi:hypothetical protein
MAGNIRMALYTSGFRNAGKFFKNFPIAAEKAGQKTIKQIAEEITTHAKQYAPRDTGKLEKAINFMRKSKNEYIVFVEPVERWDSYMSVKARKIYPIAQELGYKPHLIKRSWTPQNSKYHNPVGGSLFARKFTPYMRPAIMESTLKNAAILRKAFNKEVTKLWNRTQRTGGRMGGQFSTGLFGGNVMGAQD